MSTGSGDGDGDGTFVNCAPIGTGATDAESDTDSGDPQHSDDNDIDSNGDTCDDDDDDDDDNDDDQSISDDDDDAAAAASFDADSDEVPVWVRGERRWISGLCADTTCGQLVEALLRDDGLLAAGASAACVNALLAEYVISEKWRSVEQILAGDTRVLNIWTAWGEAQSQVRTPPSPQSTH